MVEYYRYRRGWAHGHEEWETKELGWAYKTPEELQAIFEEIKHEDAQRYYWSDKYRGLEVELVPTTPALVSQSLLKRQATLRALQTQIEELEKWLAAHS